MRAIHAHCKQVHSEILHPVSVMVFGTRRLCLTQVGYMKDMPIRQLSISTIVRSRRSLLSRQSPQHPSRVTKRARRLIS